MYGRRSGGKRLRMDESQQQYNEENDSNDAEEEAFDPIAFYQQQRSEMLIDQASHVQASQSEIQQAQLDAQLRDRMHQEPSHEAGPVGKIIFSIFISTISQFAVSPLSNIKGSSILSELCNFNFEPIN